MPGRVIDESVMRPISHRAAFAGLAMSALATAAGAATQQGWRTLAPLPQAMTEIVGIAAAGKLYVMGGLDSGRALGTVHEYDESAARWIAKKPMPVPAHHIMAAAVNGRIFVFGGFIPSGDRDGWLPIDRAWDYDPQA